MIIQDLNGNEFILEAVTETSYELNGNRSLSFVVHPTENNLLFIHDIDKLWNVIDNDDNVYKIIYLNPKGRGESLSVQVKAIPKPFDDLNVDRVYERIDEHMTANECFSTIFNGTGYTFTLMDSFLAVQWQGFGEGATRLEMFKDALNRYGAEFELVGTNFRLYHMLGRDTQFMYHYKLNASNISKEEDAAEYWTYARGYGDFSNDDDTPGLESDYTSPLADIIGVRHAPPVRDGRITTEATMQSLLEEAVESSVKISVSATAHDLKEQGYPLAQPEIGDRVFLVDDRINLNTELRVVDIKEIRNVKGELVRVKVNLGTQPLAKRREANIKHAASQINDLMSGKTRLPVEALDVAITEAAKVLQEAQSQLDFGTDGIIAYDATDPNRLVMFNSEGIGISDDGGATFKQAVTSQGINTDLLTAGTIDAERVTISAGGNDVLWIDGTGEVRMSIDSLYIGNKDLDTALNDKADATDLAAKADKTELEELATEAQVTSAQAAAEAHADAAAAAAQTAAEAHADAEAAAKAAEAQAAAELHADGAVSAETQARLTAAAADLAEAKAHADAAASTAQTAAEAHADTILSDYDTVIKAYADAVADAEAAAAEVYADGLVSTEEQARIADVQAKLTTAKEHADELVDLLKIGGRNLIMGGTLLMGHNIVTDTDPLDDRYRHVITGTIQPGTYTINFDDFIPPVTRVRILDEAGTDLVPSFGTEKPQTFEVPTESQLFINFRNAEHTPLGETEYTVEGIQLKLEKGTKATDWTPAPEDVEAAINEKATNGRLDEIAEDLQGFETVANANAEDLQSLVTLLNEYKDLIDENKVAAGNAADDIRKLVDERIPLIETDLGGKTQLWNLLENRIVLGEEGINIGAKDGSTAINISTDRIDFIDGSGTPVAYITGQVMRINRGIFVDSAQIGEHKIETIEGGHTIFTWV